MKRRDVLRGTLMGGAALALYPAWSLAEPAAKASSHALAALEKKHGGRLGVAILDLHGGQRLAHRGDERFLMCSTFKLLLVATLLARVDAGKEDLGRRIVFDKTALLDWSPVTGLNVGAPGMSINGLCGAAMIMSDNSAANLLLDAVGGPSAVTAFARRLGDTKTRLDHGEPQVNAKHGDDDTTTPWSMLGDMRKLLLGGALSATSRERLTGWFVHNLTGAQTLRAGLPSDWRIGDKTGSGHHANNDVAIAWPPRRKPLLIASYYETGDHDVAARQAVLAEVGRIAATL
ncbi:MAG TPA: class A beta-lactamase [Oleiagrimonas sp.]|nr:class A beta-lactamase [Oleiagrimonas sp.]